MIHSIAMKVVVVCAAVYVASFTTIKLIGSGIDAGELMSMLLDHRRCYEHPWFMIASVVSCCSPRSWASCRCLSWPWRGR